MYPKDYAGMQSELGKLEAKNDYLCQVVTPDNQASVPTYSTEPGVGDFKEVLNRIEGRVGARWVDAVLVEA